MTASIKEVEDAIVQTLSSITGLRAWTYLPDNFTPPCVIVSVGEIDYHGAFGNGDITHDVPLLLILARSSDRAGQEALDTYRSPVGDNSFLVALETDRTLGGVVSTLILGSSKPAMAISINGAEYLAAEFTLTVHV